MAPTNTALASQAAAPTPTASTAPPQTIQFDQPAIPAAPPQTIQFDQPAYDPNASPHAGTYDSPDMFAKAPSAVGQVRYQVPGQGIQEFVKGSTDEQEFLRRFPNAKQISGFTRSNLPNETIDTETLQARTARQTEQAKRMLVTTGAAAGSMIAPELAPELFGAAGSGLLASSAATAVGAGVGTSAGQAAIGQNPFSLENVKEAAKNMAVYGGGQLVIGGAIVGATKLAELAANALKAGDSVTAGTLLQAIRGTAPKTIDTQSAVEDFFHERTPNEAAQDALAPPKRKAMKAQQDLDGARPYFEDSKNFKEAQENAAAGKKEIWSPYKKAIDGLPGDVKVLGPDGSETVRSLEAKRVDTQSQLSDYRAMSPIDQAGMLHKSQKIQELTERYEAITEAIDPVLRKAGIDPTLIRKTYGQVNGVAKLLAGRNVLSETAKAYGLRKIFNGDFIDLVHPGNMFSDVIDAGKDVLAGRSGMVKPTDMAVREGFRPGIPGSKPNLTPGPHGSLMEPPVIEAPQDSLVRQEAESATPPPPSFGSPKSSEAVRGEAAPATPVFHSTAAPIDNIENLRAEHSADTDVAGPGVYLTRDAKVASQYNRNVPGMHVLEGGMGDVKLMDGHAELPESIAKSFDLPKGSTYLDAVKSFKEDAYGMEGAIPDIKKLQAALAKQGYHGVENLFPGSRDAFAIFGDDVLPKGQQYADLVKANKIKPEAAAASQAAPKPAPAPAAKPAPAAPKTTSRAPMRAALPLTTAAITAANPTSDEGSAPAQTLAPAPQMQTAAKAESRTPADTLSLLDKAAKDYDLDPRILHAQARQESGLGLDNEAVSSKGARGVMQLMPRTAKSLGVDAHDTAQNVDGGARLMGQLRKRFGGRYDRALAAYDWSPDKVQAAIDTYGDKWLEHTPDETQKYVHNILRNAVQ